MAEQSTTAETMTFKRFLESVPPGQPIDVYDLGYEAQYGPSGRIGSYLSMPEILLHCDTEVCGGPRYFSTDNKVLASDKLSYVFMTHVCRNCGGTSKTFALAVVLDGYGPTGTALKIGELPMFGPPTPPRLIKLLGPQKDLFLKGRRAEIQGLGIGAFSYYRRIIEDQKNRIFDSIIKVCGVLGGTELIAELEVAKEEMQFSKAVESIKHGLPQVLLVNGHNPLTLLHSALSEGLHAQTDQECLQLATSIRVVMADFVERVGQVMKDEAELMSAVSKLVQKKATPKVSA